MSAAAIIEQARTMGVSLRVVGNIIKVKGPRPAVEQILPTVREHKPELLAVLAESTKPPAVAAEVSGHWLIIQAERMERWFAPAATRAELEARYPGAALIPLPERSEDARPATPEEAAEIRRLVAAVAAQEGFSDEDRAGALSNALRDPEAALRCFRALLSGQKRS